MFGGGLGSTGCTVPPSHSTAPVTVHLHFSYLDTLQEKSEWPRTNYFFAKSLIEL